MLPWQPCVQVPAGRRCWPWCRWAWPGVVRNGGGVLPRQKEIEMTERTNAPSCPYCSHIETDAWEIDFGSAVLDGDTCHTCNSCGREYNLSRHVSVSYSARPIIDDPACNPQAKGD